MTPEQIAFLTVELQGPTQPFPQEVIKDIIAEYCRDLPDYKKERIRLLEERKRFQNERTVLDNLRQLDILKIKADLDWLLNYCETSIHNIPNHRIWNTVLNPLITRYRQMLPILRKIYSFMTLSGKSFDTDDRVSIQYPQFLLDDFFYGVWNSPTETKVERVRQLCKIYQTFVISWENRLEEAKFDVASWGPYADERFSCSLTLMDLSIPQNC